MRGNQDLIFVWGASDDLIEISNGPQEEEFNQGYLSFETEAGTIGRIEFDAPGFEGWNITLLNRGVDVVTLIPAVGDDHEHEGLAKGLSSYSDVLVLTPNTTFTKLTS